MSIDKNKYFSDMEWSKKLQELQYKYENKINKKQFKEFRDSLGEIVNRKLTLKQEALDAFRVGKAGKRFENRCKKLNAKERLYTIEVEESLVEVLDSLISLYKALPKQLYSKDEQDLITFLRQRKQKMRDNLYHKKDRLARPEVYTDINHRYDTQKRER